MNKDARFYFANLGADVARCVAALHAGDEKRYKDSLDRAYRTLTFIRNANRPEAYEEGMLMIRGVYHARSQGTLFSFNEQVNKLTAQYLPRM
jgi:hypothetical protein